MSNGTLNTNRQSRYFGTLKAMGADISGNNVQQALRNASPQDKRPVNLEKPPLQPNRNWYGRLKDITSIPALPMPAPNTLSAGLPDHPMINLAPQSKRRLEDLSYG